MDFQQIITYLLTDKFMFVFFRMILNTISVIMIVGLIKSILKQIPALKESNWRRIIQTISNMVAGGTIGYLIYNFDNDINILLGSVCGFCSAVVYKIAIKQIYDKFGVNCESNSLPPRKNNE